MLAVSAQATEKLSTALEVRNANEYCTLEKMQETCELAEVGEKLVACMPRTTIRNLPLDRRWFLVRFFVGRF